MLIDRLYRMAVNAKVFRDLGRFVEAANCYETMLVISPSDARVGEEYVKLLMQLGKREFAAEVSERLKKLNKAPQGGKGSRYEVE
jgi:tetratricopeptide (TPR) repeat protein